jgi:hypothetical protein
MIPIL